MIEKLSKRPRYLLHPKPKDFMSRFFSLTIEQKRYDYMDDEENEDEISFEEEDLNNIIKWIADIGYSNKLKNYRFFNDQLIFEMSDIEIAKAISNALSETSFNSYGVVKRHFLRGENIDDLSY